MTAQPVRMTSQKFTIRQASTAASAPGPGKPPAVRAAATSGVAADP